MDETSAELWVAAGGVLVALVAVVTSWILTRRANRIAEGARDAAREANDQARDALRLQARIDARTGEFREVNWSGGWVIPKGDADPLVFKLVNTGLTPACSVTLILEHVGPRSRTFTFDTIAPGEAVKAVPAIDSTGMRAHVIAELRGDFFRVHWTSPLGHPDELDRVGTRFW